MIDSATLTFGEPTYDPRECSGVEAGPFKGLVIARISGLCSEGMENFSTQLPKLLEDIQSEEEHLVQQRQVLIDHLHASIHGASAAARRALLEVKRDLFNGRSLASHRNRTTWSFVEDAAGPLASALLRLEEKAGDRRARYNAAEKDAIYAQYRAIDAYLDDPLFRCGLSVASRTVGAATGRLKQSRPEDFGRRERKMASTSLRYISRAALKLSPFSTFTPVGLCEVGSGSEPMQLADGTRRLHSLVRLRRHILDRFVDLLCQYEPWRRTLQVWLNDSPVQLADGRTLHRVPSRYQPDEARGGLVFCQESLVRASFHTETAERLKAILNHGGMAYGELLSWLSKGANDRERASLKQEVDRLIEVGFVTFKLPWSGDDGHLERTLLSHLSRHSHDAELRDLAGTLTRIVEIEDTLLADADPVARLLELQSTVEDLMRSAARLCELPHEKMTLLPSLEREVYQDLWSLSDSRPNGAIVRIGRLHLQRAQESIDPWLRFCRLFDRKIDLLFSIGHMLQKTHDLAAEVGLLQAFDTTKDLFRDFVAQEWKLKTSDDCFHWRWNPFDLPVLHELAQIRESAREKLAGCIDDGDETESVSIRRLNELLETVPGKFTRNQGGACLFLQPADAEGSMWVLNRLKEGTGRMSSRYTALMPESLRSVYTEEIAKRSYVMDDDEHLLLLDIHCTGGDTLNVHAPQTQKVLTLPGSDLDIDPARRVRLCDLVLSMNKDGWPRLRDRDGQGYLTAYIGIAGGTYLPTFVKFLCSFGPTDTTLLKPQPRQQVAGSVTVTKRRVIGNVVLLRRTWQVEAEILRPLLKDPESPEAFERLHRFLRQNAIPTVTYVQETKQSFPRGKHRKPQYLDLSSPLFVCMLESMLASTEQRVTFVEALPRLEDLPRDSDGRRWAMELIADSIGLGHARE